jgi:hypothetical protein
VKSQIESGKNDKRSPIIAAANSENELHTDAGFAAYPQRILPLYSYDPRRNMSVPLAAVPTVADGVGGVVMDWKGSQPAASGARWKKAWKVISVSSRPPGVPPAEPA